MKLVYIAGKYRGETPWDVEQNIRQAEEVAFQVAEMGCVPLCPHTMYRHFDRTLTDGFWLEATLKLLAVCDRMVVVDNYGESQGTLKEIERARELGISVAYMSGDEMLDGMFEIWKGQDKND